MSAIEIIYLLFVPVARKMDPLNHLLGWVAFCGIAASVHAQTGNTWSFSGLVDVNYSLNFNHPVSRTNQLRNFDDRANQFSLSMARLTIERTADPVGFRVDAGAGRAFALFHVFEPNRDALRYVEQAYLAWKPKRAKGLQMDFGKFVSSAGAEVFDTQSNWNYSRSLLYAWAVPYYHFGLRTSLPLHKNFTAGVQVVNGWNNVKDNNRGKTVGLTGTITTAKLTWSHNYYAGPEKAHTNRGYRHLYDTTLLVTPNAKVNFYLNVDYGVDRRIAGGADTWKGVAGAARFAPREWFAISPRLEWLGDAQGFVTGTAQSLKEFTLTAEFKTTARVLLRPEYRRDWSDRPFFDRGAGTAAHRNQHTLLVGIVAGVRARR